MIRRLLDRQPRRDRAAHHPRVPRDGIESVAVYSDADARRAARRRRRPRGARSDRRPPPRAISRSTASSTPRASSGADAVHPGYGFLSENAAFAAACETGGRRLRRPAVARHRADGLEDRRAQADAESAGVPVVPGETPADQIRRWHSPGRRARRLARPDQGVGRRRRQRHADASAIAATERDAVQAARREAAAAFGDGTLYVERLIERPRHVEVQVFADAHGRTSCTSSSASARCSGAIRR